MRLLSDIGGTNARFALSATPGEVVETRAFAVADFACFEDALARYLDDVGVAVSAAAIAAAGPKIDGRIDLTNAAWVICPDKIRSVLPDARVAVFNDLEAIGFAAPWLRYADVRDIAVGAGRADGSPILTVNVGTGFGAAVTMPEGAGWRVLPTEAGHMTIALDAAEAALLGPPLRTVEDVLSGPGLHRLRESGADPAALKRAWSQSLGRTAGDLTLGTGAWGGVRLCGGVLADFDGNVDEAAFLGGFRDRTGLAARLADIEVKLITHPNPALIGLSQVDVGAAGQGANPR